MLNVKVIRTGEFMTIPDVEPLPSAVAFKALSDTIWSLREPGNMMTSHIVSSCLSVVDTQAVLDGALHDVDEAFVLSSQQEAFVLGKTREGEEVSMTPQALMTPDDAYVGTYSWDERNTTRQSIIDGVQQGVMFTDEHVDFYRELVVGFGFFGSGYRDAKLAYRMQRIQYRQDQPTELVMMLWHSKLARGGYEGTVLHTAELSVEQEMKMLDAIRTIGGYTAAQA